MALKRSAANCTICHKRKRLEVPGIVVEEINPTGAGVCFSTTFIASLEAGWSLEQVGRFANTAGVLTVTQLGPMEGAPT